MGAGVAIDTTRVEVVPGSTATLTVRVRNSGTVVDQFDIDVVGDLAPHATVQPPRLSLFPGAEGVVTVVFAPPRTPDLAAGDTAAGLRVQSQEDPTGSATEEVTVAVLPFADLTAELVPRTSKGARQGEHDVAIDNRGNAEAVAAVTAADPDQNLLFAVEPAEIVVPPGSATFVKVRVRPVKRFLRGPAQHRPFQVVVEQPGLAPIALPGAFLQQPSLPRWLSRAVAGVVLVLVALTLLWFTVLWPTIKSAAREALREEQEAGAGSSGGGGRSSGGSGGGGDSVTTLPPTTTPAGQATTQPIDGRLFLTSPGQVNFTVPEGKILQLTDIILQNPAGEAGRLEIRRGDTALLVVELANFRDLDYHFVAPIVFGPGQQLVLSAACTSPTCTPGAYFAGYVVDA